MKGHITTLIIALVAALVITYLNNHGKLKFLAPSA